ncbi:GNAT family N-acetyltransferase [Dactylosporangium sp. NPDC051484]|uniref:GNAT family N-acetyltransferase n=1 Tax=Dactylosporangium sp. NPDC051484 TaxID=3154942 RepID=UPI003450D1A3
MTAVPDVLSSRGLAIRYSSPLDPIAEPLLRELDEEYLTRYGPNDEMRRHPAAEFAAPGGAFLLVLDGGVAVAGGAFRRYDDTTAEFKRVWTHRPYRRTGLGSAVLRELEAEAARRGYRRVYLTTGPRQPEAVELYHRAGYRRLFDEADPVYADALAFEKFLDPVSGGAAAARPADAR